MMTVDELLRRFDALKEEGLLDGDMAVIIDCGSHLAEIEDIDLGASDEGVVIWCGDRMED